MQHIPVNEHEGEIVIESHGWRDFFDRESVSGVGKQW
jgi:hypothetical protein